jgi:hypothetical protein
MKPKQFIAALILGGLCVLYGIFSLSTADTRYFDASGRQVSESEYREIVKKWNETLSNLKKKERPADVFQKDSPPVPQHPQHEPSADQESGPGNLPLWRVESGAGRVYLLGSIHVMQKSAYPLPQEIENAYKESNAVIFEMDMEQMNTPSVQALVLQAGQYPAGQSLQQNVSPGTFAALEKHLTALGLPSTQFNQFKPWFCAITLSIIEFKRLGFDPEYGIDAHFDARARSDGKQRGFLESPEYQISLFSQMDQLNPEAFLKQTLTDLERMEGMTSQMMAAWRNGDVDGLSVLREGFDDYPEMEELLIVQRNKNWLPVIEGLIEQGGNALVIVGCLHLIGKDSVVDLLREKGYQIVQVSSSSA